MIDSTLKPQFLYWVIKPIQDHLPDEIATREVSLVDKLGFPDFFHATVIHVIYSIV